MRHWLAAAALGLAGCQPVASPPPVSVSSREVAPIAAPDPVPGAAALLGGPRQKGRYAPRDDCAAVPGAAAFRGKLAAAVVRRDAAAVAALAAPDVKLGFAGDDGRERLLQNLKENGALFGELAQLLPLGCAVGEAGDLTMPWYFAQDFGAIDGYSAMIVTGEDVPLRTAPDATAAVTARLSWEAVELAEGFAPDKPFQHVAMPGGAKGYVATDKLRSVLSHRLLADRHSGEWRIGAIVAGD